MPVLYNTKPAFVGIKVYTYINVALSLLESLSWFDNFQNLFVNNKEAVGGLRNVKKWKFVRVNWIVKTNSVTVNVQKHFNVIIRRTSSHIKFFIHFTFAASRPGIPAMSLIWQRKYDGRKCTWNVFIKGEKYNLFTR